MDLGFLPFGPRRDDSGSADNSGARYRALVHDYVLHQGPALRIRNVDAEEAVLFAANRHTLYLHFQSTLSTEIRARIEQLVREPGPRLEIVVVGGPPAFTRALTEVCKRARRGVLVLHWTEDERLWASRRSIALRFWPGWLRIQRVSRTGPEPVDEETFEQRLSEGLQRYALERVQVQHFAARFRALRPVATHGIIAATLVVFGFQLLWGGAESSPVLWRMGSMSPEQVKQGEPWRLLSYAWLHSGWAHVLINMWVLSVLGGLIERLIGAARLLSLYVAGALGGGIAVLIADEGQTVGASGAVWALLTASFVISLRKDATLPEPIRQSLRRSGLINLGLNLAISLLPQVSMAGHLGGGIVGAVLVASGLIKMPAPGVTQRRPGVTQRRRDYGVRQVSLVAVAAFVGSAALAWRQGRPWTLDESPEYVRVQLPDAPLSLELPEMLAEHAWSDREGNVQAHLYGRLMWDPALVDVRTWPGSSDPEAQREELTRRLGAEPLPEGVEVIDSPRLISVGNTLTVRQSYRQEQVIVQLARFYVAAHYLEVEVAYTPRFESTYAGLIDDIVRSVHSEDEGASGSL